MKMSLRADYVIAAPRGELDVCTSPDIVPVLMATASGGSGIVVDLADLAFMDCGSLHELVAARAKARLAGGDLRLACPQPIVLRLFFLSEMIAHWPLFASVDEALSANRDYSAAE